MPGIGRYKKDATSTTPFIKRGKRTMEIFRQKDTEVNFSNPLQNEDTHTSLHEVGRSNQDR